ncbi:alpha/beta hydrolase [Luteitalea sp. TBR-22]|uniref:alpha/beta hydrolase n=1 Tax=Luteitalea sp. TBR-22 TaxID=2802971 RepID=UPI001EF7247C|nr:alpha/beta hydrolase [Luteitalea sp. TBR-22]
MLTRTLMLVLALALSAPARAQEPRAAEIPLWSGVAPGSEGKSGDEVVETSASGERRVTNVHRPSITPYLPAPGTATGVAVLVIPGGGHRQLVMTHEGDNPAAWLRQRGIAAFVLKHRLAREPGSTYRIDVEALADAARAMRTIRARATEWGIDPARIGAMGFSAGGELVAMASIRDMAGDPAAADPIDRVSARPDFQALIYPGRSGDIVPDARTAPAFLAAAYDDRQDIAEGLAEVYLRFKRAGVPAELHMYGSGGHGFGVRATTTRPVGAWIDRFEEWLRDRKVIRTSP